MIFERDGVELTLEQFERVTGVKWISALDFADFHTMHNIIKKLQKLHKKGEVTIEQLWLGKYFQKEILSKELPNVSIRWIDSALGWGVFAEKNFRKNEFIAEYVGKVRKRIRADKKNAYCFEYLLTHGVHSSYTIDALEQGSLARYINHSSEPNCNSSLATIDDVSHVIIYTNKPIAKGEQLCYDYGPDYWKKRASPLKL